jgi:hypothetical protein
LRHGQGPLEALCQLATELSAAVLARMRGSRIKVAIVWQRLWDWTSCAAAVKRRLERWPDASLPGPGIAYVRRWCEQRLPDGARDQVQVECDIGPGT